MKKNGKTVKFFVSVCFLFFLWFSCANAAPQDNPLVHLEDFSYEGGFRIKAGDYGVSRPSFSTGKFAYSSARNSVFYSSHVYQNALAEYPLPNWVNSQTFTDLEITPVPVQNFSSILGRAESGNAQSLDRIGGMVYLNGKLLVQSYEFYDAPADNTDTTLVVENATDLSRSEVSGFFRMNGAAHTVTWLSPVPEEWQSLLGFDYIAGSSNGMSINSRCSMGPSAFGVNSADVINAQSGGAISTEIFMDFDLDHIIAKTVSGWAPYGEWDQYNSEGDNDLWTEESSAEYGIILPGTRTYAVFGSSGMLTSGGGYKITQTDGTLCGGPCPYDPLDVYNYYWFFDVNELLRVKNGEIQPYEVKPYEYGIFETPFDRSLDGESKLTMGGGSYDAANQRLLFSITGIDTLQNVYEPPAVIVGYGYEIDNESGSGDNSETSKTVWQNFDSFPATGANEIPRGGGGWEYTTSTTNSQNGCDVEANDRAAFCDTGSYSNGINDIIQLFSPGYNNTHMGFENWGYLEIDADTAVLGNSLRYVVTGGQNSTTCASGTCVGNGLALTNKEQYLNYLEQGQDPVVGDMEVGNPYLYFLNTSYSYSPIPFEDAVGNNRFSLYVKMPSNVDNGAGGYGNTVGTTINVGPYSSEDGQGHWYHNGYVRGGGWAHILVDSHPQHNNSWSNAAAYPYPSYSLRSLDSYFDHLYRMYVTFLPYDGISTPEFSVWFDEFEYLNDPEPQNEETISTPIVMYSDETGNFEVSLNDKYKNNQYSYSTYQLRYSFSQITNDNWESAIPVHILDDARFSIVDNLEGKFGKWWPYYQGVWAPFKLLDGDMSDLESGTRIYFAIKDISQVGGNTQDPITSCHRGENRCGRDYRNHGDTFDYEGDSVALNLIKRIDYVMPTTSGSGVACGDGSCNGAENCQTCADDCGQCRSYGLSDFIALQQVWLTPGDQSTDINQDSIVNARDLGIMMSSWED